MSDEKEYKRNESLEGFVGFCQQTQKPLGAGEQKYLLFKYSQSKDIEIRNKLIEHNLKLVEYAIRPYIGGRIEADDLMQIGIVELINAIDKFDPSYDVQFSTYAVKCIRGKIQNELRKNITTSEVLNDWSKQTSCYETVTNDEGEMFEADVRDRLDNGEDVVRDYAEWDRLERILRTFTDEERYITEHYYGLNGYRQMSYKELCEKLGYSKGKIYLIHDKIKKRLKDYYSRDCLPLEEEDAKIKKIKDYISKTKSDKSRVILNGIYGLNGYEKKSVDSLAKELKIDRHEVVKIITHVMNRLDIPEDENIYTQAEVFDALNRVKNANEYKVAEYYFGLNGKERQTNMKKISEVTGISYGMVQGLINTFICKVVTLKHDNERGFVNRELTLDMVKDYYYQTKNSMHKIMLELMYGLNGQERKTNAEIAEILGITHHTVSYRRNYIENKILVLKEKGKLIPRPKELSED